MKEIGERFQEARESIDISVEEAAEDLKVAQDQIENIEAGNIKAFENVVALKYLIKDYSKYLGLDAEDMLDEYNEYLFDCTSKISLEDIKAAKKKLAQKDDKKEMKKEEKKIKSPYTEIKFGRKYYTYFVAGICLIILLMALFITIYHINGSKPHKDNNTMNNVIR